jgi:hypothetical protein
VAKGGKRLGSGRPKGAVSKATADIKAQAGKYTPEALMTLASIMKASDSDAARVSAAKELLDRAHGKSPQPQTGEGGTGPILLAVQWLQPSA